ncbi:MAG: phosphate ABC transporter ATP-binding protein PstB [Bacteroidales bacterium]
MTQAEAKNINVWYDDFHALKDISMTFEPNTVTALIGPSGCGKSTFLRLFNRMNDLIPSFRVEGLVTVNGQNVYSREVRLDEMRKNVGMVFQKPNPFPKSIYENVAYGLRVNGTNNKKVLDEIVEHSLKQAVLWDEVKDSLKKSAMDLSGGQQQRLCIARALAVQPKLILMDEPASALDPISTSRIEELITELKNDYTIIIVTHNLQQAGRISDSTAFFYLGEMVEHNLTQKIFLNPDNERTQNYITGRFG